METSGLQRHQTIREMKNRMSFLCLIKMVDYDFIGNGLLRPLIFISSWVVRVLTKVSGI